LSQVFSSLALELAGSVDWARTAFLQSAAACWPDGVFCAGAAGAGVVFGVLVVVLDGVVDGVVVVGVLAGALGAAGPVAPVLVVGAGSVAAVAWLLLVVELLLPQPATSTPQVSATSSHVDSLRIMIPPSLERDVCDLRPVGRRPSAG
jgi:hypothetical protein